MKVKFSMSFFDALSKLKKSIELKQLVWIYKNMDEIFEQNQYTRTAKSA